MGRLISPEPGAFKSIQRGTINLGGVTSSTATITAVDTAKASLRLLGFSNASTTDSVYIALTNSTTITATRPSTTGTIVVSWELTEVY